MLGIEQQNVGVPMMAAHVMVVVPVLGFPPVTNVLLTISDQHVRVVKKLLPVHPFGVEADQTAAIATNRTRSCLAMFGDSKFVIDLIGRIGGRYCYNAHRVIVGW